MNQSEIIQRLDSIRNQIGQSSQVDAADMVMGALAVLTEQNGFDAKIRQHIRGNEWCARGIRSSEVALDDLKDLCWQVIEEAEAGKVAQNVQTHLPFGLDWGSETND